MHYMLRQAVAAATRPRGRTLWRCCHNATATTTAWLSWRFGVSAAAAAFTAVAHCDSSSQPRNKPHTRDKRLRQWKQNNYLDRALRRHPSDVELDRLVVVVVGITGSGKSSTGNTLVGRQTTKFKMSSSVASETRSVAYRDYSFLGTKFRLVDTPGLQDTNIAQDEVVRELKRLARLAPHGIACFVVVIPRGRFTEEHERAVASLQRLFGADFVKHTVVAVTRCKQRRDELLEDVARLPLDHFLRRFVEAAGFRVVPVENVQEPQRNLARMQLHQRILDTVDKLEDAAGAKPGTPEAAATRYNVQAFLDRLPQLSSADAAAAAASSRTKAPIDAAALAALLQDGPAKCTHTLQRRQSDGTLILTIECELERGVAPA